MSVLPPELENYIFSFSANDRPLCIPKLALVAKRVQHWTEPILYGTLVFNAHPVDGLPTCDLLKFTHIRQSKTPAFLRDAVRNVLLMEVETEEINTILSTFPGIENLFVFPSIQVDGELVGGPMYPELDRLALRRLHCDFATLLGAQSALPPLSHPSFAKISHLSLFGAVANAGLTEEETHTRWKSLAQLPSLTHLSLNRMPTFATWECIIDVCSSLRAFVVLYRRLRTGFTQAQMVIAMANPRFVMVPLGDYMVDWQQGAVTGDEYFARVDKHISRRISGDIDCKLFH
ncbi:hypothetical protein C8F01DRAFT_787926 [Mycena amicta]|nr:hypothetical protein C8F01DRAFT_787926 [Mycena amicta]